MARDPVESKFPMLIVYRFPVFFTLLQPIWTRIQARCCIPKMESRGLAFGLAVVLNVT